MKSQRSWWPTAWGFLVRELAPFPGRMNPVWRTLLSCTLVITISMTLNVPFLALSLIMVFFITQANAVVSWMVGKLILIGIPLSVLSGTLVLSLTFGYPLLRLLLSSVIFCACMFYLRVSRFSLMFFVVGFVTIYVQSLVDIVPDPETLLRTNLWVGMATFYAALITVLVNTFFLPTLPTQQFSHAMHLQVALVLQCLDDYEDPQAVLYPVSPQEVEQSALVLQKLLRFATLQDSSYAAYGTYYQAVVVCIVRLMTAAAQLPESRRPRSMSNTEDVAALRASLAGLPEAIDRRLPWVAPTWHFDGQHCPPIVQMQEALSALARIEPVATPLTKPPPVPFLVAPDAYRNPIYFKFVMKALLATLLCYLLYNSIDWPGIHTIMLTSVITSLPTVGASTQKAVLRLAGCLVGAVFSILAMVLVEPHIVSLVGLLCMSLPVIALSAWVGAGSDRSAYAGTQIMFCFALTLLEDFGPIYDLTLVRDRIVGIVLGVVIATTIQTLIWPEHERHELRKQLIELLRDLAGRVRRLSLTAPTPAKPPDRLGSWNRIAACEAVLTRVQLEAGSRDRAYSDLRIDAEAAVDRGRRIIAVTNAIDLLHRPADATKSAAQDNLVHLIDLLAGALDDAAIHQEGAKASVRHEAIGLEADHLLRLLDGQADPDLILRLEQLKAEVFALRR